MATTPNPDAPLTVGSSLPEPAISIASKQLRRTQWWAALFTIGIPTVLTGFAVTGAVLYGISAIALGAWAFMHFATIVGITVGYHRLLAHRSFAASPGARTALVVLASMAAEGPLVFWVSNHRRHHQFSDKSGDVHTPHGHGDRARGFLHAHLGWMFTSEMTNAVRYSKDLLKDPTLMLLHRLYPVWVLLGLAAPALVLGLATWSWRVGLEVLLWAGFVRVFTVHHCTWAINSFTHLWGARPFKSADQSANVAWLAIPSAGESWHNGHHAFPGSARFGMSWWQLDIGYLVIRALERLGLASDVKEPSRAALHRATQVAPPAAELDS